MNLNGLRYGENLFALLDDPVTFQLTSGIYNPYNPFTGSYVDYYSFNDPLEGNGKVASARDWWGQFVHARDGVDLAASNAYNTANGLVGPNQKFLYMPGSPASRPFRPMSHYDDSANLSSRTDPLTGAPLYNSLDDTLLRTLPIGHQNGRRARASALQGNACTSCSRRGRCSPTLLLREGCIQPEQRRLLHAATPAVKNRRQHDSAQQRISRLDHDRLLRGIPAECQHVLPMASSRSGPR